MRVATFNANGLPGKADMILSFLREHDLDIMFVTETWLRPNDSTTILRPCLNLTRDNDGIIAGGRRYGGGILAFTNTRWQGQVQVKYLDPAKNYAIIKAGGILFSIGYFSPGTHDDAFLEYLDHSEEYAEGSPLICLGDFNARIGDMVGDHATNARGEKLRGWIQDHDMQVVKPVQGTFTTFNVQNGGTGMPDLVLASGNVAPRQLVAHENQSLGGSDHRPLTFEIDSNRPERTFDRWHVRKFLEPGVRERYRDLLTETRHMAVEAILQAPSVNHAWQATKRWYETAAEATCGRFHYSSTTRRDFMTPHLQHLQQKHQQHLCDLQNIAKNNATPRPVQVEARRLVREAAQELRAASKKRKTEVFCMIANNLSERQNSGALLKILSGSRARRTNGGCKLDPEKMNLHTEHFQSTFGKAPNGFLGVTEPFVHREGDLTNIITLAEIQGAWKHIPFGKAAGTDGILGEMISYGEEAAQHVMWTLFNFIRTHNQVPDEWHTALIVPIYKNKGSDTLAKNYRPIALTCVSRRLMERVLCTRLESICNGKISDFQGGFRRHRSTLQQVFCLHEVMVNRPELETVLLDLRAAYDSVDRRILWTQLRDIYNIPSGLIALVTNFFEGNMSQLLISSARSAPMQHLRGLLQGSSLSPLLFNLFINALLGALEAGPMVSTSLVQSNTLAFADDLVLHAHTKNDMHVLLGICEEWSRQVGMCFAPDKCITLDARYTSQYTLYQTPLGRQASVDYLGIPFTELGIDLGTNITRRATKAKAVAALFAQVGMNLTGFTPEASARIYKSFVRPVMEYGLGLAPLTAKQLQPLQRTQQFALRAILSAPRHASTNAIQKLLHVPPMEHRNQVSNVQFATSLHNSTDEAIPAVRLWWNRAGEGIRGSLVTRAMKNPLWPGATKTNHLFNRLRRRPIKPQPGLSTQQVKDLCKDQICRLDPNGTNIAGAIEVGAKDPIRHLFTSACNEPVATRVTLTRWMTGSVVRHDRCRNCPNGVLTRQHALECSGALDLLQPLWPARQPLTNPAHTLLDNLLNGARAIAPSHQFYTTVSQAIGLVYTRCLHFSQASNGYWAPRDAG